MHKYLSAVGFSSIKKDDELVKYLEMIVNTPDSKSIYEDADGNQFVEIKKEFGSGFGLALCGTYKKENEFTVDYYYPFLKNDEITITEPIEVERHSDKESYAAVCDDIRLGVTVIYYLQNINEYKSVRTKGSKLCYVDTALSALSLDGKIILPSAKKTENQISLIEKRNNRKKLIMAAREGDEDAIETLTAQDIDTFSMLTHRAMNENILSIVNTSIMPTGVESDKYSIVADILDYRIAVNIYTGEELYIFRLGAKEFIFNLCINKKNLIGVPDVGRRFIGNIWLQGKIQRKTNRQ